MNIGILTFHRAENFGAVMQCYALQTYLHKLGHQVHVIDYRCKSIEKVYHIFNPTILLQHDAPLQNIRNYIGRLRTCKDRLRKKRLYQRFRRCHLWLTEESIYDVNHLPHEDVIVVGSDQVWNTVLTGGMDDVYFLNRKLNVRKVAYAVSSEAYSYKDYEVNQTRLTAAINDFVALSVREESLREELRKYTNKPISVTLDPTFLLEKQDYLCMAKLPTDRNYILVYHLLDVPQMSDLAHRIAEKEKKKVIEIHAGFKKGNKMGRHLYNIGPEELMGYIIHAEMVITSSFHGLVFAVLFHKRFWVIDNGSFNRQRDLLNVLGLQSRVLGACPQSDYTEHIDYDMVEKRIVEMKKNSIMYIKNGLS